MSPEERFAVQHRFIFLAVTSRRKFKLSRPNFTDFVMRQKVRMSE